VHELILSYPRALLREALGFDVDPLDRSLAAVQSAFITPVGSGFATYRTGVSATAVTERSRGAASLPGVGTGGSPRRRRFAVPVALALVLVAAGTGWWVSQGYAGPDESVPAAVAGAGPKSTSSASAAASTGSTSAPRVKDRKPEITLESDLAFARDSASLSAAARRAIAGVARDVRRAGLTGTIRVNGYTDDLGSARHGLELSQQRADAVRSYLRSRLRGVATSIVAIGHGEADPIASNATEAGRLKNRRVTIDLPRG
jgi:outer membrane protein OmpA-like peptidoglycan-associated protein